MKIKQKTKSSSTITTTTKLHNKYNMLAWMDSPCSSTGFGTVAKNVLPCFYDMGFTIDVLGINFFGDFYDREKFPYTIIPSSLGSDKDPYGYSLLIKSLKTKQYDILFVINDTFVTSPIAKHLKEVQEAYNRAGRNPFKIIYYYPVDCHILNHWTGLLELADRKIAYNNYGFEETKKHNIVPDAIIPHGVDTSIYKPISIEERIRIRSEIFKIQDDNTFLWINVNRNSLRKDLSRTIYAFSEFKKKHENSKLYLHTAVIDGKHAGGVEIDLQVPCRELGLEIGEDVMFPNNFVPSIGIPENLLNTLCGAADGHITTALGEGYGLTNLMTMAVKVPMVAPDNTAFSEIFGGDKVRGYLYPCNDKIIFDSSGYRNFAHIADIVNKMEECYNDRFTNRQNMLLGRAYSFSQEHDWKEINKQWISLVKDLLQESPPKKVQEWI